MRAASCQPRWMACGWGRRWCRGSREEGARGQQELRLLGRRAERVKGAHTTRQSLLRQAGAPVVLKLARAGGGGSFAGLNEPDKGQRYTYRI